MPRIKVLMRPATSCVLVAAILMGHHLLESDSAEYKVINAHDSKRTERLLELGRISQLYTCMPFGCRGESQVSLLYFAVIHRWGDGVALCILFGGDPLAAEAHCPEKTARACAEKKVHRWQLDVDLEGHEDEIEHDQYMLALVGGRPVDVPLVSDSGVTALMYAAEQRL